MMVGPMVGGAGMGPVNMVMPQPGMRAGLPVNMYNMPAAYNLQQVSRFWSSFDM